MVRERRHRENLQHLEAAFETFSQLSEQLVDSYHQLQGEVQHLDRALSHSRTDGAAPDEEARRLANRLQCLLEALPGGVVVLDGCGVVQECNPAAAELLGEPLKGALWRDVISRAFAPRIDDGHEVSLRDGRRVSISTSSLGSEAGQILLLKDVTETRSLQDKLARYQRLSAMGQMAATLAHQVRTPAASALLYTSQLASCANDEERVRYCAEKIRTQLRHIEAMVGDMLGYARGDAPSGGSEFPLTLLLDKVSAATQAQIEAQGGSLTIDNGAAETVLRGNVDDLAGALANIVMNGLQACPAEPRLTIQAGVQGEQLHITIQDNGAGIAPEMQARIFEPFVTSRTQGTGLGLAVAKRVINAHGGEISFETAPARGTTFAIALPLDRVGQERSTPAADSAGDNREVWL